MSVSPTSFATAGASSDSAFDDRIVQVGIQIDGQLMLYENLDIRASGVKLYSATASRCSVRISNFTRQNRDYILSKATPLNSPDNPRQNIYMTLDVGRQSYGTFRLFEGNAWAFGATQPPDIGITLESITNNLSSGLVQSVSFGPMTPLSAIAAKIANGNGLALDYKVTVDKQIANYSYTGPVNKQVQKLCEMGGIIAYVDGGTLYVRDAKPMGAVQDEPVILLSQDTGMIGVPQPNMMGVTVKALVTGSIKIGSQVNIQSIINPSANGQYTVWAIEFDVANRSDPFWYTLHCRNNVFYVGNVG